MDSFDIGPAKARLVAAPPVYAPGGPVCLISNYPGQGTDWQPIAAEAKVRGAVLLVVPVPEGAPAEADLLAAGFTFASRWYTGRTDGVHGVEEFEAIRPAAVSDVPRILELGDAKRRLYETFSPVFWKVSPTPFIEFAPYMTEQVEKPENIALVFEREGTVVGYCIVQKDYVDDFTVESEEDWADAGRSLLLEASRLAREWDVEALTVVCGHADAPKRAAIEACGFTATQNWLVLPL